MERFMGLALGAGCDKGHGMRRHMARGGRGRQIRVGQIGRGHGSVIIKVVNFQDGRLCAQARDKSLAA